MYILYNGDTTRLFNSNEILNEIEGDKSLSIIVESLAYESFDFPFKLELVLDGSHIDSPNIVRIYV